MATYTYIHKDICDSNFKHEEHILIYIEKNKYIWFWAEIAKLTIYIKLYVVQTLNMKNIFIYVYI